ncbi:MAG: glutamate--cysteine ligase [Acidimicrobiales bacterium]|nr:glutamate--cysteine ligase [Acidimicrobiales bacterium]
MRTQPGSGDGWAAGADGLREVFDAPAPFTIGLEEEVLLLDRHTLAPAPVAREVVRAAADGPSVKLELPAAQVELATRPHTTVAGAIAELVAARRVLVEACGSTVVPAAAAVHPTGPAVAVVNDGSRYAALVSRHGDVARRQLVGALQVHVALGSSDRTLAVYNALRGYLPELAALAAAAPFHDGRDTGLASVRPLIAGQLPRQGVPPGLASWDAFAAELAWGRQSGALEAPGMWWWEVRPHVGYGTLEIRVPDVQPTVAGAAAVASVVHGLVLHLAARHADGEDLGAPSTWRIEENRWLALRHGVEGELADLRTGERRPTRVRLHELLDEIERSGGTGLDGARRLVERNAAMQLRGQGLDGATRWLAEVFVP